MDRYQNAKIYTIRCRNDETLIYVGSTVQSLSQRWSGHKKMSLRKPNILIYKTINNDWSNWNIELYEEYKCDNKEQLLKKEGEVIRLIATLNKKIEGRTDKEYRNDNKDKITEYKRQYAIENKDKVREYRRQYAIENIDKIKELKKHFYENNKKQILENNKQYRNDNKDKVSEYKRQYAIENKDKVSEYRRQYYSKNADEIKERARECYLKKKQEQQQDNNIVII